MQLTRRTFGAMATGVVLDPPLASAQAVRTPSERRGAAPVLDAVVLGAGVAGLNAAWLLEQQGAKVRVLEARRRVGGRVYTLSDQPGYPEMGFNAMAAGYGRGIDAAKRAGVELVDVGPRYARGGRLELVLGGRVAPRDAWATSPDNPFPEGRRASMPWEIVGRAVSEHNALTDWSQWADPANASLDVALHAFLVARGLSDAAIRLAFDTSPYYGVSSRDVSALMFEFSDAWGKTQAAAGPQSFAVQGGNQKLPAGMAGLLRGDLLLDKEVTAIASDATAATVTCADGTRHSAKSVICALPFSTLRRIAITPALAGLQGEAVSAASYQPISIAFLQVRSPFWEADGLSPSMWTDGVAGTVYAQHFGVSVDEVTGLTVQARGELAHVWDRLGRDEALRRIVAEIEAIRPAARGQLVGAALHSWTQEPFSRGDWMYFRPGQIAKFARFMSAPANRIHFCGEHTAMANRGLEGALESSERAVLELISA